MLRTQKHGIEGNAKRQRDWVVLAFENQKHRNNAGARRATQLTGPTTPKPFPTHTHTHTYAEPVKAKPPTYKKSSSLSPCVDIPSSSMEMRSNKACDTQGREDDCRSHDHTTPKGQGGMVPCDQFPDHERGLAVTCPCALG